MPPQLAKPQDTKILKHLRINQQKSGQEDMADALSKAFKEATGITHYISQPDVSRLEHDASPIDIFKLLAYSYLCKVDIGYLLKDEYKSLLHNFGSVIQWKSFTADSEAEKHLFELEHKRRVLISPEFPSSFFRLDKSSKRYQQLNSPDYEANELYTIDAFISFLFSPVGPYNLDQKATILEDYIHYFQNNTFRQLHFFPSSVLPEYNQLTCMELLPEQKMLLIPGPITHYGQGDAFIEIRDKNIYNDVAKFYRRLHTFENSMIYLRLGLVALERMRDGSRARNAITSFALEILQTHDPNALEAIKCFTPEIQAMIDQ